MPKEIDAIPKLYDYVLWMIPKLERFPRSQKFILVDRIENRIFQRRTAVEWEKMKKQK